MEENNTEATGTISTKFELELLSACLMVAGGHISPEDLREETIEDFLRVCKRNHIGISVRIDTKLIHITKGPTHSYNKGPNLNTDYLGV